MNGPSGSRVVIKLLVQSRWSFPRPASIIDWTSLLLLHESHEDGYSCKGPTPLEFHHNHIALHHEEEDICRKSLKDTVLEVINCCI